MAVQCMIQAGVVPITWMAVLGEWQRDWAREKTVQVLPRSRRSTVVPAVWPSPGRCGSWPRPPETKPDITADPGLARTIRSHHFRPKTAGGAMIGPQNTVVRTRLGPLLDGRKCAPVVDLRGAPSASMAGGSDPSPFATTDAPPSA